VVKFCRVMFCSLILSDLFVLRVMRYIYRLVGKR
jgi:hypothetical protein